MADEDIKTKITIRGGNWEPSRETGEGKWLPRPVKYLLHETESQRYRDKFEGNRELPQTNTRGLIGNNLKISSALPASGAYFISSQVAFFSKLLTDARCGGAYKAGKKHLASLFWFNEFNVIIPQWFSPFGPHWRHLEALEVIEVEESARQTLTLSHLHSRNA